MDFSVAAIIGLLGLAASGVGIWVTLRERVVRVETKIDMLERQDSEHKSEFAKLRDWLENKFDDLSKALARKADR